ncbi:MAG TPA: F-box protein, partial [Parachlamydiaceae bacterium]|nr:F-box protein [Parachlamydiaceae bacterium]
MDPTRELAHMMIYYPANKKKAENELEHYPIKKPKTIKNDLLEILPELVHKIFDYLSLQELGKFSQTSKNWTKFTADMPFWKRLCWEAKLILPRHLTAKDYFLSALKENNALALSTSASSFCESEAIRIESCLNDALAELRMLYIHTPSANVKEEIENKINYLKAVKACEKHTPLLPSNLNHLLEMINQTNLSSTMLAIAATYLVIARVQKRNENINDNQAVQYLQVIDAVSHSPTPSKLEIASWIHAKANYLLGFLRLHQRTNAIDDTQAVHYFQKACNNSYAQKDICEQSEYHIAEMRFQNRTTLINDDQAFLLFQKTSKSSEFSIAQKQEANFYMAKMVFHKRTNLISGDKAFLLFQKTSKSSEFSIEQKQQANFYMAKMVFHKRTDLISDDEVFQIFENVKKNIDTEPDDYFDALFYMAQMRYQKRTASIDDIEAFKTFEEISKFNGLSTTIRKRSFFFMALMRLANRTNSITDRQAASILQKISQSAEVTSRTQKTAKYNL